MLNSLNNKIETEKKLGVGVSNSESFFKLANESFFSERYNETASLIDQSKQELEKSKSEGAFARTLKNASLNFILRYWFYILIFIALFVIFFKIIYKKLKIYNLTNTLEKYNIELGVLNKLIIKAQTERYKDNKLSGIVYNIRVKKYKEKISEIKEQIPVLESRLKKLLKK